MNNNNKTTILSKENGVKVLSLFDGMCCGMIAMMNAGLIISQYDAFEIDKYAIKTSSHNFPMIKQHGDVFDADFTEFIGFDWLIGGSPCTHWSIAQTKDRETEVSRDEKGNILLHSSGIGFELFSQYLRALYEAKPRFFIYENNKSMSKEIRAAITECFGFEPICINSSLVSAQNRQRLYWVGKRNDDGTYSKVDVEQPKDRGILLKDVLDSVVYGINADVEPISVRIPEYRDKNDKSRPLNASYSHKGDGEGSIKCDAFPDNPNKQVFDYVAEPISVRLRGRDGCTKWEAREDKKAGAVDTIGARSGMIAEPITDIFQVGAMPMPSGELSTSAGFRIYSTEAKGRYLCANGGGAGAKTGLYAVPILSERVDNSFYLIDKNGKKITVYEVKDGKISIKDKQYPIKLKDGYYIIRKLTVNECKRLQTVPEWYDFSCVSNTQAYKMLGNGWTCDVITHLIISTLKDKTE